MKKRFLKELESYLAALNKEERDEILRFYEERFHTSMVYEGKSEEEILDELESPRQIARNVLEEYGYSTRIKQAPTVDTPKYEKNIKNNDDLSVWRVVWLVLFDVLLLSAIVGMLFGLFFGLGGGLIGFMFATLIYPLTEGGYESIYLFLLAIGVSYLWFLLLLWIYDLIVGFFTWLVRWHLDVLKFKKASSVTKTMKKFQFSGYFKRNPALRRLKSLVSFMVVIMIIFSGFMVVTTTGGFNFDRYNQNRVEVEELVDLTETINDESPWRIKTDIDHGAVKIIRTNSAIIRIHGEQLEDYPYEISIDESGKVIEVLNQLPQTRFSFSLLFAFIGETPLITIEIPNDLIIESIDMKGTNGYLDVNGFDVDSLTTRTTNGLIRLTNVNVVGTIDIMSTNGEFRFVNVTASTILAETTNGRIIFEDVEALNYTLKSTNGEIRLTRLNVTSKNGLALNATTTNGRVDLSEVYVKDVTLRTTNGNINYNNTDLTFVLDRLSTSTTNGSVNSNVPKN
jgi:uncharacterized membrane protein